MTKTGASPAATRKVMLKLFVSGLELGHSTFLVGYWILIFIF
jgi:hypothetical protein